MTAIAGTPDKLFLVGRAVRPGDVLLTLGVEKFSKVVSKFTQGPFSHAAILGMRRPYSLILFEALDDGIGETPIALSRIEKRGRRFEKLYALRDTRAAILLRHPKLAALSDLEADNIGFIIIKIVDPYLGMRYPTLYKLADALPADHPLKLLYHRFGSPLKSAFPPKDFEGPFCSALVSLVYQKLGIELFSHSRSHETISPNDFLKSELKQVPDAITGADASDGMPDLVKLRTVSYPPTSREKCIVGNRGWLENVKSTKEFLDSLDSTAADISEHYDAILARLRETT